MRFQLKGLHAQFHCEEDGDGTCSKASEWEFSHTRERVKVRIHVVGQFQDSGGGIKKLLGKDEDCINVEWHRGWHLTTGR